MTMDLRVPLSQEQKKAIYDSIGPGNEEQIYNLMNRIDSKYNLIYAGELFNGADMDKSEITKYIEEQKLFTQRQKDFFKNLLKTAPNNYVRSMADDLIKLLQINDEKKEIATIEVKVTPMETPVPEIETETPHTPQAPIFLHL